MLALDKVVGGASSTYSYTIDYIHLIPGLETGSRAQVVYVTNDEIMLVAVASYKTRYETHPQPASARPHRRARS